MKRNLSILVLLLAFFAATAQTNKLDKDLDKANELIRDGKYADADKYLVKLLDKNPDFGKGWDLLVELRYQQYTDSKKDPNLFGGNMRVTVTDKNGKDTIKNDSLANKLMAMLNSISPVQQAYNKFLYTAREATLMTTDCYASSFYLRALLVDINVDSNVNEKALKYFNEAESNFTDKNYEKAATLYKRALEEQPGFYKASLYLGDTYYEMGYYADAATAFMASVQKFPYLLEPRKYLIDAYAKLNQYDNALNTAIESMTVYPDYSDEEKLSDAAYFLSRKVNITWTPRPVFPNKIEDTANPDLNAYTPDKELEAKKPWTYYEAALDKIKGYCNNKGIIVKPNPLTQSRYLEVYSWEEMLANSNDPQLDEARKMQKAGYLDCYVLVTCFHQDFYPQYLDFVSKNRDKVMQYFKTYIN